MTRRYALGCALLCLMASQGAAQPLPIDAVPTETEIVPSFQRWQPDAATFDAAKFRDAIRAYELGQIAAGDALAATQTDRAAMAALEWAAIRKGRAVLGFDRLVRFVAGNPGFPMEGWIRRRAESALFDEKRSLATARAFFTGYAPDTAAGRVMLALVKRADGEEAAATQLVREAWRDNSLPRSLEAAIQKQFPNAIGMDDIRFRAERLMFQQQSQEALRVGQPLGQEYIALLGALRASTAESSEAEAAIERVAPTLRQRASYVFAKAQTLRRKGKLQEAAQAMLAAPRSESAIASGEEWWNERRLLARSLLDKGDATTAYAVASGYNATKDKTRIEAEFHAGWIALRFLHDAEAAEVHFARGASFARTPLSLSRSFYWLGRARDELHRASAEQAYEQAAIYGATFYGQLATERIRLPEINLRSLNGSAETRQSFESRTGARVIRLLLDNNARDLALPLAVDFAQTLADQRDVDALGDLLTEYRDPNLLLTVAKLASQRGMPMDRHAFPLFGIPPFEPVENSAERAVIYAIARQESAFDPKAVSHAGARGLMQMMPATAAATARQFNVPFDVSQLTGNPAVNAKLGAAHLGHLMQTHRSSYMLVFGGYNAGPGRVREWIEAYGDPRDPGVDMVDWIERIPISETRNYVQRVMENFQVYRALITGDHKVSVRADLARGMRSCCR